MANAPALARRPSALAGLALGANEVFVKSAASNLHQLREKVRKALEYSRSGADQRVLWRIPPSTAAAMESRAFPAFSYDPAAPHGERSLENNPQPERDWPLHALSYEDAEHQRISEETAFTLLDFVACDVRANMPNTARLPRGRADAEVPSIPMVDADNRLHRVIVGEAIAREARRCLDASGVPCRPGSAEAGGRARTCATSGRTGTCSRCTGTRKGSARVRRGVHRDAALHDVRGVREDQ